MDFLTFFPLTSETLDSVRARMDTDANAGLVPTDPAFMDLTIGGFYYDLTQPAAIEADRLWDFASTEVIAAAFVSSAWGPYLDLHGVVVDVPRKDEVKATGEVTLTGTNGTVIPIGTEVAVPAQDPDQEALAFVTTAGGTITGGTLTVAIEAVEPGSAGNVASGTISLPVVGINGLEGVSNEVPTSGGADVESDEVYRQRLLLAYRGAPRNGTQRDYQRIALAFPGVGFATVEPEWSGAGTVRVVIADPAKNPNSATTVDDLQDLLDPTPGTGDGLAPIGAKVTVATVTTKLVNVTGTITYSADYTQASAQAAVDDAIAAYINGLGPGDDVIWSHVVAAAFQAPGVYDVRGLALNGVADNVAVGSLEVAQIGTVAMGFIVGISQLGDTL